MKKKNLFHLLSLLLCCCLSSQPLFVHAADEPVEVEGPYTFVLKEDGTAKITMYDKSLSGVLSIPDMLGGTVVTEIGEFAFRGDGDISAVTVPDSVKGIGYRAFDGNTALERITLPKTMDKLEGGAFSGCERLTSVTLPDGLDRIDNALFEQTGLREIVIPEGVESIGAGAFRGCTQLENISLPLSMKIVEEYAFNGCTALKNLQYAGSDGQYSSILIFPDGEGNKPLQALKEQDPSVLAKTPFVPCRGTNIKVPAGATVIDYYNAKHDAYIREPDSEPPTLEQKMRWQRDMRLAGIDKESYFAIMIGDIDDDGNLSSADARNVLRISVGLDQPTEIAKIAADVDRDDNVTASDARLVLRGAVGLENTDAWKV